jgi:hypothetical protein
LCGTLSPDWQEVSDRGRRAADVVPRRERSRPFKADREFAALSSVVVDLM